VAAIGGARIRHCLLLGQPSEPRHELVHSPRNSARRVAAFYLSDARCERAAPRRSSAVGAASTRCHPDRDLLPGAWSGGGDESATVPVRIVNVWSRFARARLFSSAQTCRTGRRAVAKPIAVTACSCAAIATILHMQARATALARTQRRARKIKQRLGVSPERGVRFALKPTGMWQQTYECLRYR